MTNIIYWKEEPAERKWKPIPDTPEAKAQAIKQGAMFFTSTAFSEAYKSNGQPEPNRMGDLVIDADCAEDPGKALQAIKTLCLGHLPEMYGIDPYAIRFYASGSKGFHAETPASLFGAQDGDPLLPLIYKRIMVEWVQKLNLYNGGQKPLIDLSMYCMGMGKMFRTANVKRSNGRYKMSLTLEEIRDLSIDELMDLTKSRREVEAPIDPDLSASEELETLFRTTKYYVHKELKERPEPVPLSEETRKRLSENIPQCIAHILTAIPGKSDKINFNKLVVLLVTYFQMAGWKKEAAWTKVRNFVTQYPHSGTYETQEKRSAHFNSEWEYLSNNPNYCFHCGFVKALGLPGSAFECNACPIGEQKEPSPVGEFEGGPLMDGPPPTGFLDDDETAPQESPEEASNDLSFPSKIMSGVAGDFARIFGEYLEPPECFFYMSYLTIFGLYVSDRLFLQSQRKPQPRLYTILLGESGDTRKSTAMEETDTHFREFVEPGSMGICRGAASGEGLGKLIKKMPKVLLYYDEMKVFVSKCKIKQSTLLMAANTLFESNRYENATTRDPFVVERGYLSMLAASTVDTYAGLFDSQFMDIGFNNRLFLIPADSAKCFPIPRPIPEDSIYRLYTQLRNRLKLINPTSGMPMEPEADERWAQFYTELRKDPSPYTKRLDTYGLRLMPLLAINDLKKTVDLETTNKVITLLEWQYKVRQIHDPIDAEGTVARMEEKIRRALKIKQQWQNRELQRKVIYSRDGIWVWESAVKNLTKNRELRFNARQGIYTTA